MTLLTSFDSYLDMEGPAAIVLREHLMPVEGSDGVVFPSTYASGDGFPGGYNIDTAPDGTNVCLIDSIGSQANRIEPIFLEDKYKHLVPQIYVKAGDKEVSIFEAGHRAGDALLRCSELRQDLQSAFKKVIQGDSEPIAKIAPTSLVFGVWDSRDTQAKLPRLVSSVIRAYNVRPLKRSAQYNPPLDYSALNLFSEEDKAKAEGNNKSPLAQRGFVHVPATGSHGGVIAHGGIRRDATLGLAALRLLHVGKDKAKTLALRRYILGLSLIAFTHHSSSYLRQGCMLVQDPSKSKELVEVFASGERKPFSKTEQDILNFATEAANAFGVGETKTVKFDGDFAKKDLEPEEKKTKVKKGTKKESPTAEKEGGSDV